MTVKKLHNSNLSAREIQAHRQRVRKTLLTLQRFHAFAARPLNPDQLAKRRQLLSKLYRELLALTGEHPPMGFFLDLSEAKFEGGRIVSTPGALKAVPQPEILQALDRHFHGDWGECCPEDANLNDESLRDGSRLLSVYHSTKGERFWIITEADRSATTILLPSEY